MVRKLIQWSLDNPLFAILMAIGLAIAGVYSFLNINVEAYPDPAPPTVEIVTLFPGASAEEVEKQVTIPLESALASMPGSGVHAYEDGVWLERRQAPLQLRRGVQGGASGDDQSPAIDASVAARRHAADFPGVAHREKSIATGCGRRKTPRTATSTR